MGVEGLLGREEDDVRVVGGHDEIARAVMNDGSAGRVDEGLDGAGGLGGAKQVFGSPDVDTFVELQVEAKGEWRRGVEDRVWLDLAEFRGHCFP